MIAAFAVLSALPLPAAAQRARIFSTDYGGPRLRVSARVETEVQPKSVSVSPDGRRLAVCNFGRAGHDNVFLYDSETLEHVGAVHFEGNAVESAWSADGRTLYVSNFRRHMLEVIDVESLSVRAEVPVGSHPKTIALSPDGALIYVANYFGQSITVLDSKELREVRTLTTGERPRGMAVLDDGTLLSAAFHGDTVHVFPQGAEEQSAVWEVCRYPRDILATPDGAGFYMTCSMGHIGFYRADGAGRPFGIAGTGRNPRSIGLTGDGRFLGVANFTSSDVTLIDTVARTHRRIEVPGAEHIVGLAMHPDASEIIRMYATSWDTAELILLTGTPPVEPVPREGSGAP